MIDLWITDPPEVFPNRKLFFKENQDEKRNNKEAGERKKR